MWPPVPPIDFPFDVQKVGNKIETEFQIIDNSHRLLALNLNYLFEENDQITRKRAWGLSGGSGIWQDSPEKSSIPVGNAMRLYAGKWLPDKKLQPAPLAIKLNISRIDNNSIKPLIQKEISTHEIGLSSFGANHLEKQLLVFPLEIGRYKLSVEVLSTSPEFNQTPITFEITFPHGGK
ncbi:DUF5625 family protein [Methylomonas methanica]